MSARLCLDKQRFAGFYWHKIIALAGRRVIFACRGLCLLATESRRSGRAWESESVAYKGMDLNLRSAAHGPGASPSIDDSRRQRRRLVALRRAAAQEPIQVDDRVEACCSSAYDAAQFHRRGRGAARAPATRMTRVKAAAELMEQLGIRAGVTCGRRRRSPSPPVCAELTRAARIAPQRDGGNPARAPPFAGERKTSATVADLLRAVLSLGRKAPDHDCC